MSEEIIEIYKKSEMKTRELVLEHLEKLKSVDEQLITSALEGVKGLLFKRENVDETDTIAVLNSMSMTGKSKQMMAVVEATEELSAFVQRQRLDVLNLCLPEAKEK
jgi:hypothetical protein